MAYRINRDGLKRLENVPKWYQKANKTMKKDDQTDKQCWNWA